MKPNAAPEMTTLPEIQGNDIHFKSFKNHNINYTHKSIP